MLAEDIRMNVLLINVVVLCQARTQTSRIQDRTRTDNLLFPEAGGLAELIGQDIDGIAYDDVNRIRRVLYYLGDDAFGNVDVGLRQIQAGLAGLSCHAGGQDDNVGILCVRIASRVNRCRGAERRSLPDIQRLSQRLFRVDID